jgi:2-polyprenyl-3-methyl-5-hydroxy-6-metoxy-1,4-benzoquinol methylase
LNSTKFSREYLLNPKKLRKGITRWNQFAEILQQYLCDDPPAPILDLGCGIGYFVYEGLLRGDDIWGVDASNSKIIRYQNLIRYTGSPVEWIKRCLVATGEELPFCTHRFAAVCSWYVLEHLANPSSVIRELVRITRKNGLIVLRAQDARNSWEGHYKIPWIPFLSGRLAAAWAEEFGVRTDKRQGVFDITQPQVTTILESLGCEIISKAPEPKTLIEKHWEINTEEEIRRTARLIKARFENRQWRHQPENLYIVAIKI